MRIIEVGWKDAVMIPDAWTSFVYKGWLYVRDEADHFVRTAAIPWGKEASIQPAPPSPFQQEK